jgi:branched-subunit amino acid transport protein
MSWAEGAIAIVGLALITLLTRGFFLFPDRDIPLPGWLVQGLRYTPLAALAAVIAPELVMTNGRLIDTWMDARLPAVAATTLYFVWRRDILGTIVVGTATLLLFRLGFGW